MTWFEKKNLSRFFHFGGWEIFVQSKKKIFTVWKNIWLGSDFLIFNSRKSVENWLKGNSNNVSLLVYLKMKMTDWNEIKIKNDRKSGKKRGFSAKDLENWKWRRVGVKIDIPKKLNNLEWRNSKPFWKKFSHFQKKLIY